MNAKSITDFVKDAVNLEDYIGRDEILKQKSTDELMGGHSAVHSSDSGTCLNVNTAKQTFNCYNCNASGSVIDYVMNRDGVDIVEACKIIADDCGLTLPDDTRSPEEREAAKHARAKSVTVSGLLNSAARFYHSQLTPDAVDYYTERGISRETIDTLQLGYAGPNKRALLQHLHKECDDKETLLATGLFYPNDDTGKLEAVFHNRYMLPYYKRSNQVCYFIGRDALNSNNRPKYKKQPVKDYVDSRSVEHVLWNAHEVTGEKPVLVLEGIIDAILARQELADYDVISPVTTKINDTDITELATTFQHRAPKQVIMCFDSEVGGSGAKGALATAEELENETYAVLYEHVKALKGDTDEEELKKAVKRAMPYITIATLPKPPEVEKIDVADYLQDGKKDEVAYWLRASRNLTHYRMWQERNPKRFFAGRAFHPKRLSDELRTEGYYLYVGECLHVYKNGVYRDGESSVPRRIEAKLGDLWKKERETETLAHLQIATRRHCEQTNPAGFVNLRNGILNCETMTLAPHSPYHLSTVQYHASWKPNQDMPAFGTFLEELVAPSDIAAVMEMTGYAMMHTADLHTAFILLGEGANGKSTLLKVMTRLFGTENITTVSLQRLQSDRFAVAKLYGKAANIYPDMPIGALRDSDIFKSVTSGDRQLAEKKFRDTFEFDATATQIVSVNKLPRTYDGSKGFFRRLHIIEFPKDFENSPQKKNQHALVNEVLTDRDAIATQCLLAAAAAVKRGHFTKSERTTELVDDYRLDTNPEEAFIEDYVLAQDGAQIGKAELYQAYKDWLEEHDANRRPIASHKFSSKIKKQFPHIDESRGTGGKRFWIGIELVEETE